MSDLYSAQLTSQLARPAKETPINTLARLEQKINESESFLLLVEKNSASYNILKNGTGVVKRLFEKMVKQHDDTSGSNPSYLLNSVEEGAQMVLMKEKFTAVFAGRQTLYFNMKKLGMRNFQLSEKLFTRYSSISIQKGSLFVDKLNLK